MPQALQDLAKAGVAVWLDDLSRPRLQSGGLARMVERGEVVGITTNPTIFAKAIGAGSGYEEQLRKLALRGTAKVPFASTFGRFLERAFDQVEMAIISGANLKLVGTHVGVTLASDGPSQMALADVAFMRAFAHALDSRGNPASLC